MGTEPQDRTTPPAENAVSTRPREWPIEVRPNGTILFDGIAIGGLDLVGDGVGAQVSDGYPRLTLNAGWIRLAGLSFRVQDDPERDSHRDGLVLDR